MPTVQAKPPAWTEKLAIYRATSNRYRQWYQIKRTGRPVFILVAHLDGRAAPTGVSGSDSSWQHVLANCSTRAG